MTGEVGQPLSLPTMRLDRNVGRKRVSVLNFTGKRLLNKFFQEQHMMLHGCLLGRLEFSVTDAGDVSDRLNPADLNLGKVRSSCDIVFTAARKNSGTSLDTFGL
jgi:hypothetical protein